MAAALLNNDFGDRLEAVSAGLTTHNLQPQAIAVMAELEIGLDLKDSNCFSHYERELFDYVITLCPEAEENCPLYFGGVKRHSMNFTDPSPAKGSEEEIVAEFRKTRDDLRQQLGDFFRRQLAQQ
jgi:arsenate reductase